MFNNVELNNFGPLESLKWPNLGPINLVIGGNGTGKTFLLKSLYTTVRTLEEHRRGDVQKSASEILADKLFWTFQPEKIGDLVTKSTEHPLSFSCCFDEKKFSYSFGKDTTKQIHVQQNDVPPRKSNSIFLPAKEVLSLHKVILKSREEDKSFGFDDTYLDLARALRRSTTKGNNYKEFSKSRQSLEGMLGGKIDFDSNTGKWTFKKGNQKFPIGVTAEGIKKISILDTLLGNRYLDTSSLIFIDEPESALHPKAISQLLDIVSLLAERGIQFFMASHSYFVVKKLFLIAQEKGVSIPIISENQGEWTTDNLKNGMPENEIINESIQLYKEEVGLALK